MTSGVAFVGAPYDGAATLGWPGARYAPDEVRRHLAWTASPTVRTGR